MVFGLSYGEVAFILVTGIAILGPKDIALAARTGGRLVGRMAGYMQSARSAFSSFTENSRINELHAELQQTVSQLDAIRHELRSGVSISNFPHTVARHGSRAAAKSEPVPTPASIQETISPPEVEYSEPVGLKVSGINSRQVPTPYTGEGDVKERLSAMNKERSHGGSTLRVLPVSAVAVGWAPSREGKESGSDIVLDALYEERVARNALKYFASNLSAKEKVP